jgi:hypothetical protein
MPDALDPRRACPATTHFALICLLLAASPTFAAPPPAPEGWTATAGSGVQIYRLAIDGRRAELNLFPREDDPRGLDAWFRTRIAGGMPGVAGARFEPVASYGELTRVVNGEGRDAVGHAVHVVRMGCRRPHGGLQFAEAMLSDDDAWVRKVMPSAAKIFSTACFQGANDADLPTARALLPQQQVRPAAPAQSTTPTAAPRPYPYLAAAGKGVKDSDVEAIVRRWANEQAGMTMQVVQYYTVLFKDGGAYDGMFLVALPELDLDSAKRGEPRSFGTWKRQGDGWRVTYSDGSVRDYSRSMQRLPARARETLNGTWHRYTAYSSMWSVSQTHRSVTFTPDGRFVKSAAHSLVGSAGIAAAGNAVGGTVTSDDHGTTSTMGGRNFSARTQRTATGNDSHRMGSYRLDGYLLELHYDDGVVERKLFCEALDKSDVWFEDDEYSTWTPR